MTPDQLKATRGLLRWGINKLAHRSGATHHQVRTYERSGRLSVTYGRMSRPDPPLAIRAALEGAGVEFTDGDTPGVRLRGLAE